MRQGLWVSGCGLGGVQRCKSAGGRCKSEKGLKRGIGNRDVGRRLKAASRVGGWGLREVLPLGGELTFRFPVPPFGCMRVGSGRRHDLLGLRGLGWGLRVVRRPMAAS